MSEINTSEFAMWHAVFAFAFVDNSLSIEEQELLQSYMRHVPFSDRQRNILKEDFNHPPNVVALYQSITEAQHKQRF